MRPILVSPCLLLAVTLLTLASGLRPSVDLVSPMVHTFGEVGPPGPPGEAAPIGEPNPYAGRYDLFSQAEYTFTCDNTVFHRAQDVTSPTVAVHRDGLPEKCPERSGVEAVMWMPSPSQPNEFACFYEGAGNNLRMWSG